MDRLPKNYRDITEEWLQWNKSAGAAAPKFATIEEYAKFADGREGAPVREIAYNPDSRQKMNQFVEELISPKDVGQPRMYTSDLGAEMLAPLAKPLEAMFPSERPEIQPQTEIDALANFGFLPKEWQPAPVTPQPNPETEQILRAVGETIPRGLAQTGALIGSAVASPPVAAGLIGGALADAHLQAYAPQKDEIAGAIAPTALLAGAGIPGRVPGLITRAGQAAEGAAVKAFQPDFQDLVQAAPPAYGKQVAEMLTPSTAANAAVNTARVGAEWATGTGINEAARMGQEYLSGQDVKVFDPVSIAANAVASLATDAPLELLSTPAAKTRQTAALATIQEADKARTMARKMADGRGARIAETHRKLLRGEGDSASLMTELREHYVEADAARQPTADQAGKVLMSMSQESDSGRLTELDVAQITNAVQGRFDEIAKNDPDARTVGTVSGRALADMVKSGLLPKVSHDHVEQIVKNAYDMALGDEKVTNSLIVNALVADYQSRLPGALEARAQMPAPTSLTKTALDAQSEADKDVSYIQALLKLMPHMPKGAKAPDGKTELQDAFLARDQFMSAETQGGQLDAESAARAKYDTWRDTIIHLAETYDPVTRTGEFVPSKRLADGTVLTGKARRASLEELVTEREARATPESKPKYAIDMTASRKIGQSVEASSLEELMNFVNEKFEVDDIENIEDPEKFAAERRKMVGTKENEEDVITAEAKALAGEDKDAFQAEKDALETVNRPAFGIDLEASGREDLYDAALYLMDKVEKSDNAELWVKYGGPKVFGQGATPDKARLFKLAILAKMETDVAPSGEIENTGQMTRAQEAFYNAWRAEADAKEKETVDRSQMTWKEKRAQFRHALRLYWRSVGNRFDDFFVGLLDDKPKFQEMLRGGRKSAESMPDGASREPKYTFFTGQTDPVTDTLRLFRGFAKKQGLPEDFANDYAVTMAKMVQAFDEVGSMSRTIGGRQWGSNYISQSPAQRPEISINFDTISDSERDPVTRIVRGLMVGAHELSHNYSGNNQKINYASPYKQQRIDAYNKLTGLFEALGPDATHDLLNNIIEQVFIPEQYRPAHVTDIRSQVFGDEAVSKLMEYVMLGAFTKDSPWAGMQRKGANTMGEAFLWLPDEVQAFTRLAFRDIVNFTPGLEDFFKRRRDVNDPKIAAYLRPMMQFAQEFLAGSVNKSQQYETTAKRMMAGMTAGGSIDWADPVAVRVNEYLDQRELRDISRTNRIAYSEMKPRDPTETQTLLFGPKDAAKPDKIELEHIRRLGVQTPAWSHYLSMFYQHMRRYEKAGVGPIAEQAARMVGDLEPAYWRLTQQLHTPFIITDEKGNIKYDPNHPVQVILQNKHPQSKAGLDAINELYLWANDNETPVIVRDAAGKVSVNPAAAEKVKQVSGRLDPQIQQAVLEGTAALTAGYKQAADLMYASQVQTVSANVAKFIMVKDRGMYYDRALGQAQAGVEASIQMTAARQQLESVVQKLKKTEERAKQQPQLLTDPAYVQLQQEVIVARQAVAQTQAAYGEATKGLSPSQIAVMEGYVMGPEGPAAQLVQLNQKLAAREGWFQSESRPGRYMVFAKTPESEGEAQYANSRRTEREAKKLAEELGRKGYTDVAITDRNAQDPTRLYDTADSIVDSFLKLETASWQKFLENMKATLSEEDFAALQQQDYTPGVASQRFQTNKAMERYLQPRKSVAGREDLNAFEVFNDYTKRLVGNAARRSLREEVELLLRDPRSRMQGEFQQTVREAVQTLMQPVSKEMSTVRTAITAYFLGLPNIGSPIVESSQALSTIFPHLVAEDGFVNATKRFPLSYVNIGKYHDAYETLAGKRLLASAKEKDAVDPRAMTKEEAMAYYYRRALDERRFDHGVVQDDLLTRDFEIMRQNAFGMGMGDVAPKSKAELATDTLHWASQVAMGLYTRISGVNNRAAFLAGLDMYYDKGLRGQELYQKAQLFKDTATFGGGKSNEIGYVSKLANPKTRSAFSLINTLQRYSFGYATMLKDWSAIVAGRLPVSPMERKRAAQALMTANAALAGLGGAMALPGAAIISAVLEQMFGIDSRQAARELWFDISKRLGADDPTAVTLANYAQNGVAGQALGVDVSSRFAINSFLGFDAYEGYDPAKLLGAGYGVGERLINATKFVAKGDMVTAARYALPPGWTPMLDIASQKAEDGQVGYRSKDGKLLGTMSLTEQAAYAAGLRPYRSRLFRDQQSALRIASDAAQEVKNQQVDEAADALRKGDSSRTFEWVRQYMQQNPGGDMSTAARSVVDRALVQNNAQDLLAQSHADPARAEEISRTFGNAAPRQSEVDLLVQRERLNAQTGYVSGQPLDEKALTRAALVDALVKQQGLTRQKAVEMVEMMGY